MTRGSRCVYTAQGGVVCPEPPETFAPLDTSSFSPIRGRCPIVRAGEPQCPDGGCPIGYQVPAYPTDATYGTSPTPTFAMYSSCLRDDAELEAQHLKCRYGGSTRDPRTEEEANLLVYAATLLDTVMAHLNENYGTDARTKAISRVFITKRYGNKLRTPSLVLISTSPGIAGQTCGGDIRLNPSNGNISNALNSLPPPSPLKGYAISDMQNDKVARFNSILLHELAHCFLMGMSVNSDEDIATVHGQIWTSVFSWLLNIATSEIGIACSTECQTCQRYGLCFATQCPKCSFEPARYPLQCKYEQSGSTESTESTKCSF